MGMAVVVVVVPCEVRSCEELRFRWWVVDSFSGSGVAVRRRAGGAMDGGAIARRSSALTWGEVARVRWVARVLQEMWVMWVM